LHLRIRRFGGIVLDGHGDLLITGFEGPGIFRVTGDGEVTEFATISGPCSGDEFGLARDPATGDLFASAEFCSSVFRANPDGSGITTLARSGRLLLPIAIVVDPGK
jgi:hypothetical protein